jgi:ParB family chromosome partitioning protein
MTAQEARECISSIKSEAQSIRRRLLELDEREGWRVLGYGSIRECILSEFPQSKSNLYRQLEAARIEMNISPMGEIHEELPERVLRPLSNLKPEHQREVWAQVQEETPDGKRTGTKVQAVIDYGPLVRGPIGNYRERDDIKRCETCGELWGADLDYCPYCNISREARILHAQREREAKPHVSHNSGNNEWYTPPEYIAAAREVMGGIDLDPASSEIANRIVQAETYYTEQNSGLLHDWHGRVWMNPPYAAKLIGMFADKLAKHAKTGDVTAACVLVNNATETGWFNVLLDVSACVCLLRSRVKFIDTEGKPSGAPLQGQVILYVGHDVEAFGRVFSTFGKVLYARRDL